MHPDWGIVRTHRGYDGQTFRSSIYKTIQPKHPHSPICWYQQRPQRPTSYPHYMESWMFHIHNTSTGLCISAAIMIVTSTLPRYNPTNCYIWSTALIPIIAIRSFLVTVFDLIPLMIFDLVWLNYGFDLIRLNFIIFQTWFDSQLPYLFLIWVA